MEPVTLSLFKAHLRIAGNTEDELLLHYLKAAREKAETYTRLDFVSKIKTATYSANVNCNINADDIVSVSGFYNSKDDLVNTSAYFEEYRKGITVNRDYPIDYNDLPTYAVTYNLFIDPETVSEMAKSAIMKIASDLYQYRETSSDLANKSLSINHRVLLDPLVKITLI